MFGRLGEKLMEKRFRFRYGDEQSIPVDTEISLETSPTNSPDYCPETTPPLHVLSNNELRDLRFREMVDEVSRKNSEPNLTIGKSRFSFPNLQLQSATTTTQQQQQCQSILPEQSIRSRTPPTIDPSMEPFIGVHQHHYTHHEHLTSSFRPPLRRIPTIGLDRKCFTFYYITHIHKNTIY